jgi:hypothetical protein
MATLPVPLFYDGTTLLLDADENVILQRLYDRDQVLYTELVALQNIREDLFAQFDRLGDVEARINSINAILNTIITSFYLDIDENGAVPDNLAFFQNLIADLRRNINAINAVAGGIVNFLGIQQALAPVAERVDQLDDIDRLIKTKLDYIYGKWDVDPSDDILSL